MRAFLFGYLVIGAILTGDFMHWQQHHCPEPHFSDAMPTDVLMFAVGWGVLIPAVVVYGALEGSDLGERCK